MIQIFGDSFSADTGGWSTELKQLADVQNHSMVGSGPDYALTLLHPYTDRGASSEEHAVVFLSYPGRLNWRNLDPTEQWHGHHDENFQQNYLLYNYNLISYRNTVAAQAMCRSFRRALVWNVWGDSNWTVASEADVTVVDYSLFTRSVTNRSEDHSNHLNSADNRLLCAAIYKWYCGDDFENPFKPKNFFNKYF